MLFKRSHTNLKSIAAGLDGAEPASGITNDLASPKILPIHEPPIRHGECADWQARRDACRIFQHIPECGNSSRFDALQIAHFRLDFLPTKSVHAGETGLLRLRCPCPSARLCSGLAAVAAPEWRLSTGGPT